MIYVANAFSVNMLPKKSVVEFSLVGAAEVADLVSMAVNTIRHPATLQIAKSLWPDIAEPSSAAVSLEPGDVVVVVMPMWKGGRPPETKDYNSEELKELTTGINVWLIRVLA